MITLLSPGQSLVWTPAPGVYGSAVNAFTVKAYDGTLASASPIQVAVAVANVNIAPAIGLPTSPPPDFIKGGASILIDPAATVTDPDSVSFEGAVLTVAVSRLAMADDRLAIQSAGQIGISGNSVSHNGTIIGTFSGGNGFVPLVVQFNAFATLTSVQALLRNLTYQNVLLAAPPGARTVRLVLTDGDGGTSPPATKTINVTCPGIDVMLVLDRSASMQLPFNAPGLDAAKTAAKQFASYLDFTKDQCGVVSFAGAVSTPIDLTLGDNLTAINSTIDAMEFGRGTCIGCGIHAATAELASTRHRVGNLRVMVLLTDGVDDVSPQSVQPSADAAKNSPNNILLITVGLGAGVRKADLMSYASSPEDFYDAPTPDQLAGKYAEIAVNLCRLTFSQPAVSAGPDKVVHLPGIATLEGSVTDDGNTGNGIFNLIWSVVSIDGPGSVVFANASAAATTATFSAPGQYVLRLTGQNPMFSGSDDMVVSVYEPTGENQAPQVRAYPVERVLVGGSTTLRGSVQDDGLPAGSTVTKSWAQVPGLEGGPARVNTANPGLLETTVGPFSVSGRYRYRLTASDGQLGASDDVLVTVCNGDAGPVDVILVMDNSESMGSGREEDPNSLMRFLRARTAAKTFLDFINPTADQVGLVQFSSEATLASELTADTEVVRTALTHLGGVRGSTDIASALYAALSELISNRHRPGSTPIVVLLSDGYPDDAIAAMAAANQLKNAGVRMVTIALASADQTAARDFLRTISSSVDDAYAGLTEAELSRIYASIAESFCLGQNRRPLAGIEGPPELLINRGDLLTLRGTAADDNVPSSALTYRWTQSGVYDSCDHGLAITGTATFGASAAQETSVTFSGPGYYVLRFNAYDLYPDSGSYAEVGVLVNDVPSIKAMASQTFGWAGSEIIVPLSATVSPDSVSGPPYYDNLFMTMMCPGLDVHWSLVSGLSSAMIENASSLDSALAHLPGPGRYVLRLSADDGYAAASSDVTLTVLPENSVDAGADKTGSVGTALNLSDAATNPNATSLGWTKQEGPVVANPAFSNPNVLRPTVTFPASGSYILRLTATFGATTLYDELTVRIGSAGVQAGPDITIPQGGTATLSGSAISASGTDLAAQWFVVGAPVCGQVTFANANSKTTTATFSLAGTYQLRLKASSGADDLLVFVNQPPIVDAGPDQTVVKEKPAELTGSIVSDDLLPPNVLPTISWSKLSGPGIVTFQSVNSLKTFARFSAEGVYVLKLSVSDSHLSGDDTVTVKVVTPPVARNDVFLLEQGNEPFVLDVLRNDTDREGDPLIILNYDTDLGADADGRVIRTAGTLALINNDRQFLFLPDSGVRYTRFFYRIADRHGGESQYATVSLQIVPPPHAPKAKTDVLYTSTAVVDEWLSILDNDDDGGFGPLTIISYTPLQEINGGPGYGTLSLQAERLLPDPDIPLQPQQLLFTADPDHPGIYTFKYTVRNQKSATATGAVILVVEPASDPNSAPIVDAGEDQEIYINQPMILAPTINNDPGDWIQSVVWSCSSPNVTIDNTADPETSVHFTAPGDYSLRLTVTDGGGKTAFDEVFVRVRPEGRPPIAEIFNLANDPKHLKPDPIITEGIFELRGRATDPNPANAITYRIGLYRPAAIAGNPHTWAAWLTPSGDTQGKRTLPGLQRITGEAGDDLLGQLDFTGFPNDVYILTLEVWGGNVTAPATTEVRFALNSELRLGRLTFSEEDLAISASGFPMRLVRSYDSTAGIGPDFGWGWKYDLKDLDPQLDEERSVQSFIDDDTGTWTSAGVRSGGGRNLTLTLPDGRRVTYRFGFRVSITTGYAYAEYTPPPGVHSKLLPQGDNRLVYLLSAFARNQIEPFWQDGGQKTPVDLYEFPGFVLKMEDGTEYHLEAAPLFQGGVHLPDDTFINPRQPLRLSQILRPNGEKMMHTRLGSADDAVETYDAQGNRRQTLVLKRDGAGRVTKAIDVLSSEDQPAVEYIYDTCGRLKYVRRLADRSANRYDVTTYFYDNTAYPNRITRIEDPRQVTRTQFQYFPDGKLEKIIQPGGETRFQHDLAGMKETITDPVGTQTVHAFDTAGRITETEVKDALDNRLSKVVRSYDPATTLLISESVFLRRVGQIEFYANTSFEYDANGNVNKVIDPNSFSTRFTYNQFGQVTSATDPREKTLLNDYDYRGNLLDTTDAEGGNTHNTYVNDRLESSTSPVGALTSYTYYAGEPGGAAGDLKTVTVTEWDPELNQNVTLSKITYTYDANSNVHSERQERKTGTAAWSPVQALITTYTYDAQNRVVLTRVQADPPDPQIDSTSGTSYNSIGKPETSTDRLGHATGYNYDASGNLVQTVYPGSTVYPLVPVTITRTVYDAAGRACYIQDQHDKPVSGNSSTASGRHLVYDGLGRVVRTEQFANLTIELTSSGSPPNLIYATRVLTQATTPPAPPLQILAASETRYDDAGRVYATAQRRLHPSGDPNLEEDRSVTTHAYDDAGRRLATYAGIDDATGTIVGYRLIAQYGYDAAGNLKSVTDALHTETQPRVTEFEYDTVNRQVLTRFPQIDGEPTRATRLVEYDKAGRRIAETDELNRTTRFKYDGLERLCQVTDPDLRITTYKYDWTGNLLEQTDALNHTTSYRYDALGRRLRRTLPGQQFECYTYDAEGNRLTQTDFEQKVTTFEYDVLRRLRKLTPDAAFIGETPVQFEYYANGRRRQMMDASGQTDYDYDTIGRLKLKTTPRGRINYAYNDTSGRRSVAVTTANQNGSNRTGLGGTSLIYKWNSLNQLVSVTDGAVTTTYDYDPVGNLENINYPIPAAGSQTHYIYDVRNRLKEMTVGSANLARYVYGVAANGRRSTAAESGTAINTPAARTVEYSYDNLDRLTRELIAGDEGGKNGELAHRYDDVGNRTWTKADPFGNPGGTTSNFDENDRLGSAANYDKNGNTLVSGNSGYQYDFQNRLQRRTGGAEVVYDGDGNLAKRTLGGVTICYLVDDQNPTGHAQVLEELAADGSQVRKRYTWGLQLISQKDDTLPAGDQVSYSGLDGHGNMRFLLKADGAARPDRYVYDACGRMIRSVGTTPNVYLYCGERWDPDLGLYYLRARYLNPVTGRFMSMDTFEGAQTDPLSLHKYEYAADNPGNRVDPSGRFSLGEVSISTAISLALFGLITSPDTANAPGPSDLTYSSHGATDMVINIVGGHFIGKYFVGPAFKLAFKAVDYTGEYLGGLFRPKVGGTVAGEVSSAELTSTVAATFNKSLYIQTRLTEPLRVWRAQTATGNAGRGRWYSTKKPTSMLDAEIKSNVNNYGTPRVILAEYELPAGTVVFKGQVAGGIGEQIYVKDIDAGILVGEEPLPVFDTPSPIFLDAPPAGSLLDQ